MDLADHVLVNHVLVNHGRGGAISGNKIPRPTIKANASLSLWADFVARFNQYCSRLGFATAYKLVECIPEDCYSTLARQFPNERVYDMPFA